MSSSLQSEVVEDCTTEYEVREAVFSSFCANGHIKTTLSDEVQEKQYSIDADVKLQFRVATADEISEETDADFELEWDGRQFVRYAKYMVNREIVEYITEFEFDPETGFVQQFDMEVDEVAQRLCELEPLAEDPGFLFPRRHPNDGPPPITEYPGTLITEDIQYQLRAHNTGDPFCIGWLPSNTLFDHLTILSKSEAPLSRYELSEQLNELFHIGGGRPIVDSVETGTQAAFAQHNNGISLGLWFPYQPVPTDRIWKLADDMGAIRVTAAEKFPSTFCPQVPPSVWNCFPEPPRNMVQNPDILNPCLIQLTTGLPDPYDSLESYDQHQ